MRGYIVGIAPEGGLATISIAKRPRGKTSSIVYVDAGFGVRQLVALFGSWDALVQSAPVTRLQFTLDGQMLVEVSRG